MLVPLLTFFNDKNFAVPHICLYLCTVMKKEDFNKINPKDAQCEALFISKESFPFKYKHIMFRYRYEIYAWTYQCSDIEGDVKTDYLVFALVDEDSIHERHRKKSNPQFGSCLYNRFFGFLLRKRTRNGRYNDKDAEWLMERIEKMHIEPKIRKNRYQKIQGIIGGTNYLV